MAERSIRVLRVSAGLDPSIGGPYSSTVSSVAAVVAAGVETTVVSPAYGTDPHAAVSPLRALGVDVRLFALTRRRWSVSLSLAAWVFRNAGRFDVVHAHGAWTFTTVSAVVASLVHRKPLVLTPHESLTDFDVAKSPPVVRWVKRALRMILVDLSAVVVVASEVEAVGSGRRKLHRRLVVPHPVASSPRSPRSIPNGVLRVGYLGRLDAKKNIDLLIQSLPDSATLAIAGTGPLDEQLHAVAARTNASIEWLGFVSPASRASSSGRSTCSHFPRHTRASVWPQRRRSPLAFQSSSPRQTGIADLVQRHDCGVVTRADGAAIRESLADTTSWAAKARRTRAASAELSPQIHGLRLRSLYGDILAGGQSDEADLCRRLHPR